MISNFSSIFVSEKFDLANENFVTTTNTTVPQTPQVPLLVPTQVPQQVPHLVPNQIPHQVPHQVQPQALLNTTDSTTTQ